MSLSKPFAPPIYSMRVEDGGIQVRHTQRAIQAAVMCLESFMKEDNDFAAMVDFLTPDLLAAGFLQGQGKAHLPSLWKRR